MISPGRVARRRRTRSGPRPSRRPGRRAAPDGGATAADERGELARGAARSSGRGGSPAPDEDRVDARSSSERVIASGSVALDARADDPPAAACRDARRASPSRPLGRRRRRPGAAAGWLRDLEARQRRRPAPVATRRARRRSPDRRRATRRNEAARSRASGSAAGRRGQAPRSRQRAPDAADQRGGRGGGAVVDGEEGARLGGHRRRCYRLAARASALGRPRSGVPADLLVELLEPGDELLDPGRRRPGSRSPRQLAAEHAAQHRVEEQHRVGAERRGRAGWPRGNARPRRSGRAAGSRGRPARPARRAVLRGVERRGSRARRPAGIGGRRRRRGRR